MLNKLSAFIRSQSMVSPADRVICAVSGGADSVALLFALYLLKDKLDIRLEAAHFNHCLRGGESDRDENFVRQLCDRYDIPLHVGRGEVRPGKKGLEAAAREARYAFFSALDGKVATAHTADDNAETILMHLIRGTGLKGLGGIAPKRGSLIRPMLTVTRQEVEAFLESWSLPHVEDSSNQSGEFLRNRIRHGVMPLLKAENPRLAQSLTRTALRLRQDEEFLEKTAAQMTPSATQNTPSAAQNRLSATEVRDLPPAIQCRILEDFLKKGGLLEPEDRHIQAVRSILWAENPSARLNLPGLTVTRNYDFLEIMTERAVPGPAPLPCPGEVIWGEYRICCEKTEETVNSQSAFTVLPQGAVTVSSRRPGDEIRLPGGSKSLKKLYIDRKIPVKDRPFVPIVRDEAGVLGVYGIGVNEDRKAENLPAVLIKIEKRENDYA